MPVRKKQVKKDDAAKTLASLHFRIEPGISRIFVLRDAPEIESLPQTPIKLLEVNDDTPPSGVMPIQFGAAPDRGIPYPSIIVEVTPAEYERIRTRKLRLPDGWRIGEELLPEGA